LGSPESPLEDSGSVDVDVSEPEELVLVSPVSVLASDEPLESGSTVSDALGSPEVSTVVSVSDTDSSTPVAELEDEPSSLFAVVESSPHASATLEHRTISGRRKSVDMLRSVRLALRASSKSRRAGS
jgi:hypothetical protein